MKSVVAVVLLLVSSLGIACIFFDAPGSSHGDTRSSSTPASAVDTPLALSLLSNATAGLVQMPEQLPHDSSCCRLSSSSTMDAVLATAAALPQAAAQLQQQPGSTRQLLLAFRSRLAERWMELLQPFVDSSNSSSCHCRSVQLSQPRRGTNGQSTALLLVLNSWGRLEYQLGLYSANLLMLWFYARMHGYGLHVYVHGAELPPWMPVYFIKPPGLLHAMNDLGYSHVMYLDWDVLLSPHTSPPLSVFYGEYPAASLLLQGEYNFCAGTNLWRNTPESRAFLQAWWDMGARGCCPTTQHDQSALKHLVAAYLANFTGQPALYGPRQQQHFRLPSSLPPPPPTQPHQHGPYAVQSTESPPTPVSTWLRMRPFLQQKGSAIGLVGLDVHYHRQTLPGTKRLALHSCMGSWWGCVPPDTPALVYHTGHGNMEKLEPDWLAPRLTTYLAGWLTWYRQQQTLSEVVYRQ